MPIACVFIDRDGTINEDIGYLSDPERLLVYPWAGKAIRLINDAGLKAIVLTNQSGVARGFLSEETLALIHRRLIEQLSQYGARLDGIYYCPHHPDIGNARYRKECECRKPRPALAQLAAREHDIDLGQSWVVGDKSSDIQLAATIGARSALVLTGYGERTMRDSDLVDRPQIVAANLLEAIKVLLDSL